jgi:hypothetical protein
LSILLDYHIELQEAFFNQSDYPESFIVQLFFNSSQDLKLFRITFKVNLERNIDCPLQSSRQCAYRVGNIPCNELKEFKIPIRVTSFPVGNFIVFTLNRLEDCLHIGTDQ